ncbi:MAG: Chemotaxis response regulator protein-glutamate methylesterase [Pseudomonadota bacterium]|jgi:two-component system chemotaxis response regulator CheB
MAKKVLIVDDCSVMRTLIWTIVSSDPNLDVVGDAANGKQALDAVKTLKPDIILLDIQMPVMDGLECLKRLKLITSAKVIIISSVGQTGSPQALMARKLGAFDVISKPGGAVSMDLVTKRGHAVTRACRKAAGLA